MVVTGCRNINVKGSEPYFSSTHMGQLLSLFFHTKHPTPTPQTVMETPAPTAAPSTSTLTFTPFPATPSTAIVTFYAGPNGAGQSYTVHSVEDLVTLITTGGPAASASVSGGGSFSMTFLMADGTRQAMWAMKPGQAGYSAPPSLNLSSKPVALEIVVNGRTLIKAAPS